MPKLLRSVAIQRPPGSRVGTPRISAGMSASASLRSSGTERPSAARRLWSAIPPPNNRSGMSPGVNSDFRSGAERTYSTHWGVPRGIHSTWTRIFRLLRHQLEKPAENARRMLSLCGVRTTSFFGRAASSFGDLGACSRQPAGPARSVAMARRTPPTRSRQRPVVCMICLHVGLLGAGQRTRLPGNRPGVNRDSRVSTSRRGASCAGGRDSRGHQRGGPALAVLIDRGTTGGHDDGR